MWQATYEMTDANNEGEVDLPSIMRDLATNAGVQKSQADISDGSSIIFDKTPTDISNVYRCFGSKF